MCIFCKITEGSIPSHTIYEDKLFKVILDKFPSTKGHTLIIPKIHAENIFDIPREEAAALGELIQKTAIGLKEALNMEGLNLIQNNGAFAGQEVFHFHFHLIPRYKGDGLRFNYGKKTEITDQEAEGIIKAIRVCKNEIS